MRYVVWALLAVCCVAGGCSSEMEEVQRNGGHGVDFRPTDQKLRGGY
jgi:hypothetical protein